MIGELDAALITKRSINSVFALISRSFILNLLSFGASLLIFTLLTTQEVGVYVAVIAMQRVISFFSDFGLGAALVQNKESVSQREITTIFTFQALVTLAIFIVVFLLREFIASFFNLNPQGQGLLIALVFTIFLSSFKTIPSILLERNINFHKQIIPQIVESFVFNALIIILLLLGFKINSFTYAFLVSSIIGIPLYYYISPWKIRFGLHKDSLKYLRYGIQFQAKNILGTVKDDLLTVFLAKILSLTELSYIGFAQRFAFFSYRYIVDSVTKVTFSTYARLQHDHALLSRYLEKTLFFVSSIMFPTILGLIITSPYIVQYFPRWHNKWEGALISLIFFSLNAFIASLSGVLVTLLDATGRVKTTLKLMVLWTALTWILTPILLSMFGYNGVAIASFLVGLTIFLTINVVKKVINFDFFSSIYKPFFISIIMSLIVYLGAKYFVVDFLTLFIIILLGAGVYATGMFIVARNELESGLKKLFTKS